MICPRKNELACIFYRLSVRPSRDVHCLYSIINSIGKRREVHTFFGGYSMFLLLIQLVAFVSYINDQEIQHVTPEECIHALSSDYISSLAKLGPGQENVFAKQ